MSADIIDLPTPKKQTTAELVRERLRRSPKWHRTECGHAFWLLTRAAEALLVDNVEEALSRLRLAVRVLDPVEASAVTLAEELGRLEQFDRRQVSVDKAAATRARNKAIPSRRDAPRKPPSNSGRSEAAVT